MTRLSLLALIIGFSPLTASAQAVGGYGFAVSESHHLEVLHENDFCSDAGELEADGYELAREWEPSYACVSINGGRPNCMSGQNHETQERTFELSDNPDYEVWQIRVVVGSAEISCRQKFIHEDGMR